MLERLLITGAAGGLGKLARTRLKPLAKTLRLSDIAAMEPAGDGEEVASCDLADAGAVDALVAGCDGILHLGGISLERSFETILGPNIIGVHNLYEAARAHGSPRIFFASSNHATGYYRQDQAIGPNARLRPDTLYGASKCFGEAMATLYFDKFGQESAIVRIGSCFPEPTNHRMLATWLSADDFISLVECVFRVPKLGCPILYGVSDNDVCWWDNDDARYLGWRPHGNSEEFRSSLADVPLPPADSPEAIYQGGWMAAEPIHEN